MKAALVTGGGSGIGAAIARRLAGMGCAVAICDLDEERALEVADSLGGESFAARVDVRDHVALATFADETARRLGKLDVVCPNAGIAMREHPLEAWTRREIDDIVDVNLKGAIHTVAVTVPHMRDGGAIVITASISGLKAHPGAAVYSATKTGLVGFARSVAMELAPRHIRVNCVCPGGVDTPLLAAVSDDLGKVEAEYREVNPLGRLATADDVARAVAFLASENARHITGVALRVDGGDALMGAI